jgi:hypothetical protein
MKTIIAIVLVATAAYAEPQPAPKSEKPPKAACEAKGKAIFEIDHLNTGSPKQVFAAKLYATGAWTFSETTAEGKPGQAETGCADLEAVKKLEKELAAAKWQVKTARIHCMAVSPSFTRYLANGKQVFEEHMCGGQSLDDASNKAKLDGDQLLAPAFAAQKKP